MLFWGKQLIKILLEINSRAKILLLIKKRSIYNTVIVAIEQVKTALQTCKVAKHR